MRTETDPELREVYTGEGEPWLKEVVLSTLSPSLYRIAESPMPSVQEATNSSSWEHMSRKAFYHTRKETQSS